MSHMQTNENKLTHKQARAIIGGSVRSVLDRTFSVEVSVDPTELQAARKVARCEPTVKALAKMGDKAERIIAGRETRALSAVQKMALEREVARLRGELERLAKDESKFTKAGATDELRVTRKARGKAQKALNAAQARL